jgi:hypothetical protein
MAFIEGALYNGYGSGFAIRLGAVRLDVARLCLPIILVEAGVNQIRSHFVNKL